LARQFILAGLFYLFIKLAPAARPLSFLNVWPWRVARGWPVRTVASSSRFAALLDHRIRQLRRAAAHQIRQLRRAAAQRLRQLPRIYCAGNGPKLIAGLH
jgi:hypothetical protein